MHEILMFGLAIGAVFSLFASLALVHMGRMIDRLPTENEEERERSLWSPQTFTKISTACYWMLFVLCAVMLVPGTRLLTIAGIAMFFGLVLFMLTALVFSVVTYNVMRSKKGISGAPPVMTGMVQNPFRALGLRGVRKKRYPIRSSPAAPSTQSQE